MATAFAAPIPAPDIDYRDPKGWQAQEQAYIDRLATLAKANGTDPRLGRTVSFPVADGAAVYVVWRIKPLELVHVATGDAWNASAATIRGFRLSDVDAQLRQQDFWNDMRDEHEEYFASLPVGSIVHYDNGFAQYVRCVRVEGEKGKRLRPIALVGNWSSMDLPRRNADGTVYEPFHVRAIATGDPFEPNYGNVWETYDAERRAWSQRGLTPEGTAHLNDIGMARFREKPYQAPFDPTTAPAIDLTLPGPTAEEQALAALVAVLNDVRAVVEQTPQSIEDAKAAIALVREVVAA